MKKNKPALLIAASSAWIAPSLKGAAVNYSVPEKALLLLLLLSLGTANAQTNLTPVWTATGMGGTVRHGAAAATNGTVYVTADGSFDAGVGDFTSASLLHAFRPDGSKAWSFSGTNGAASPPTVGPDGAIYFSVRQVPDTRYTLYAVRQTGVLKWVRSWDEQIDANLALRTDGRMLGASRTRHLLTFEEDGQSTLVGWLDPFPPGREGSAPVMSADGFMYYGVGTPSLHAQSLLGGLVRMFAPGTNITGLAIGPQGILYVSCEGGLLCALNSDGTERWRATRTAQIRTGAAVARNGTFFLPTTLSNGSLESGELITLSPDGTPLRTNNFQGALNTTPALASDGAVWVTDASGKLTLLSAEGEPLAEYAAEGLGSAPLITVDGRVIVTTTNGSVIAFQSAPAPATGWPMLGRNPERTHRDYTASLPPAPSGLTASTSLNDRIVLNWSAPTEPLATYDLCRSLTTNLAQAITVASFVEGLSWTDTNVMPGFNYYYWVRARNGFGAGDFQGPALGFNSTGGRDVWHYRIPGFAVIGMAAAPDGTVYVQANNPGAGFPGSDNSRLVALGPGGVEQWTVSFGELLSGAPVIGATGEVLVATVKSQVTGIASVIAFGRNGEKLWQVQDSTTFQPPVVAGGGELLLINERNGYVIAPGGGTNWSSLNGYFSSPAGSSPPQLHGTDEFWLATSGGIGLCQIPGANLWRNNGLGGPALGMAPSPGRGIYMVNQTGVHALRADGSEHWSVPGTNFSFGPVLGFDGTIFVATTTNLLLAVNDRGQQVWTAATEGRVTSTPLVGQDGAVFFGTSLGNFQAFNADGSARWSFRTGSPIRTAPVLAEGNLFFGTDAGMVWALRADTVLASTPWPKYQGNASNQGHWLQSASGAPGSISNLAATVQSPGGTVIHLTWESAAAAQWYEVWRAVGGDFSSAQLIGTNIPVALKFDDDLTRGGVAYSYWVRGVNLVGAGALSGAVSASQTNQLWAVPFGTFAPVVSSDGTVFATAVGRFGDYRGQIAAYDPEGSRLWVYRDDSNIVSSPALGPNNKLVFAATAQGGSVNAISTSGEFAWSAPIGKSLLGDPVVDAYGTCYVLSSGTSYPDLRAVSADGVVLWRKPCGGDSQDHAVIGPDGTIYIAAQTVLTAATPYGEPRWILNMQSRRWGTPAIGENGELILAAFEYVVPGYMRFSAGGTILASNRINGVQWSVKREPVIAASGDSFFAAQNLLICVGTNGIVRWTNACPTTGWWFNGPADVPALDAAGNLYVAGTNEMTLIDHDGFRVGRRELGAVPTSPPVLTKDGRIYIAAKDRLYALPALAGLDTLAPWPMYRHDPGGTGCRQLPPAPLDKPSLLPPQPFANSVRIECARPLAPAALQLFRSATPNLQDAVLVARGRSGELFASDSTAVPGVLYYYWARFQTPAGLSAFSEPVQATAVNIPVKWFAAISDLLPTSPAIAPDGTIFTCGTNRLLALNTDSSLKWQIAGITGSPMAGPDGAVVIRSGNWVGSLSPSGVTNWLMDGITSSSALLPALGADGRVIVPRANDELVAVSSSNSPLWQTKYANYVLTSSSLAADGSIVFLRGNTQALRLNPDGSESIVMNIDFYQGSAAPVLDAAGTVYVLTSSAVAAFAADGTNRWRLPSASAVQTAPVVGVDGTVFAGYFVRVSPSVYTQHIAAVLADGSARWTFNTSQGAQASMALSADGTLLVAAGTNLLALSENDGRVLWQMSSPNANPFGPPVLDYDGTLYAPVKGGILALQLEAGPAASAWPMYRQNPRQSACIQRLSTPQLGASYGPPGHMTLHVLAPGGCVILKSDDLRTWRTLGSQPPSTEPVSWRIPTGTELPAFFRLLSP